MAAPPLLCLRGASLQGWVLWRVCCPEQGQYSGPKTKQWGR